MFISSLIASQAQHPMLAGLSKEEMSRSLGFDLSPNYLANFAPASPHSSNNGRPASLYPDLQAYSIPFPLGFPCSPPDFAVSSGDQQMSADESASNKRSPDTTTSSQPSSQLKFGINAILGDNSNQSSPIGKTSLTTYVLIMSFLPCSTYNDHSNLSRSYCWHQQPNNVSTFRRVSEASSPEANPLPDSQHSFTLSTINPLHPQSVCARCATEKFGWSTCRFL